MNSIDIDRRESSALVHINGERVDVYTTIKGVRVKIHGNVAIRDLQYLRTLARVLTGESRVEIYE